MIGSVRFLVRTLLSAAFWIFVFSIKIGDRTLFAYGNEVLVENRVVSYLDREARGLISSVTELAKAQMARLTNDSQRI